MTKKTDIHICLECGREFPQPGPGFMHAFEYRSQPVTHPVVRLTNRVREYRAAAMKLLG